MSVVIVVSAGSLNTSSFKLLLRSSSVTFNQVVFAFPRFLFVVLSASYSDILAGVSSGVSAIFTSFVFSSCLLSIKLMTSQNMTSRASAGRA